MASIVSFTFREIIYIFFSFSLQKHNFILYEGNTAILKFQGVTLLQDKSVHHRVNSNSALILIAYGNDGRIYDCRTGRHAKM